jgi:cysteine desulfurase
MRDAMIYLDHAATEPMKECALDALMQASRELYGNASASYGIARAAKSALESARRSLAGYLHADPSGVFFTSGGTESDNQALVAAAEGAGKGHLVVSSIEHEAVLRTAGYLETRGFTVTYLPVDPSGFVSPEDLERDLQEHRDTVLVSVMAANNEVGTIEPVQELSSIAHRHGALFHTDAVQAFGKLDLDVSRDGIDLLSVSAHKIGGPKGTGLLYIRPGISIGALLRGGMQERGRRAGTEAVPAIVSFAAAAKETFREREESNAKMRTLQRHLFEGLKSLHAHVTGPAPGEKRLSNNVSVSFPGIFSDLVLASLDLQGIAASAGSACTTGAVNPSHVILAMTGDEALARGSLRFTLGPENTMEEMDTVLSALKTILCRATCTGK